MDQGGPSDIWAELEEIGYSSGHLVAQCPECGQRQMVAWFTASSPKPRCRVCTGSGWDRRTGSFKTPALVVVGRRSPVWNKTPGQERNATQLRAGGCIKRPNVVPPGQASGGAKKKNALPTPPPTG